MHFPDMPLVKDIIVPRVYNHRVLTYEDQYFEVIKEIVGNYYLNMDAPYDVLPLPDYRRFGPEVLKAGFEFYSTSSNTLVTSPFFMTNRAGNFVDLPVDGLQDIVLEIDRFFFSRLRVSVTYNDYIRHDSKRTVVPTLRQLCINKLSLHQTMFDVYGGHRAVVNTTSNMDDSKVLKLFSEFSNDGISREHFDFVRKLIPKSLAMLEDFLDCRKHYGKIKFDYDFDDLVNFVTAPMSSSGVRPGGARREDRNGFVVKSVTVGKKMDQFAYYSVKFHEFMQKLYDTHSLDEAPYDLFETYCVIRLKNEFKYVYPPSVDECAKLRDKCREFFIPNMMQQFLSKMLMTPRQLLERGDVIRIGQKWYCGEAQRFAQYMHAFSDKMVWYTGDFKKLDKSIRDWMLSLYVATGRNYFYTDSMSDDDFVDKLFAILCERINIKLVNHIGGVWTLMRAFMYSGGYETSHGDSWCVLLAFCLYVVYTADRFPNYNKIIYGSIGKLIRIVVYGDDHVWCTPIILRNVMNEHLFAAFVNKYIGMTIRDPETKLKFFSTTHFNGELKYVGVVFLKRYFIKEKLVDKVGFPIVYPFKPTHDSLIKLFCSKEGLDFIYPLQAIGQAYDTLGTNSTSYLAIKMFYDYWIRRLKKSPLQIFNEAVEKCDSNLLRKIMRRSGLTLDDLKRGFPGCDYLLSLHRINPENGSNVSEL
jgi:hypothetical protein